ncbi:MAG: LCP family protein [Patescibacteria group bacterium]
MYEQGTDTGLPGDSFMRPPSKRKNRWLALALFFLVLAGGSSLASVVFRSAPPNEPEAYHPITLEPKKPQGLLRKIRHFVFSRDIALEGERKDRINILLLGMGGVGHDGPFLTDTIMLGSIQPSTHSVALISIPRDLEVSMDGYGTNKINHANAFGEAKHTGWGGAFTAEVVEQNFDIDIHYYVRLDFKAFEEIIDAIGGITVNVERSFTDHMYPAAGNEYQTISFEKGVQTMEGERALQYARSRHGSNGEGSDFARAKRQQKMLLALKEKALSFGTILNPVRLNTIMESLDTHLTTNMEFSEMITLLKLGKEFKTGDITSHVLDTKEDGYLTEAVNEGGAFVLRPKTGNFEAIQSLIDGIFEGEEGSIAVDTPPQLPPPKTPASIEIQNGTWRAGLAARMKKRLEDRSFSIRTIGNTEKRPQVTSGIYRVSKAPVHDIAAALQEELHIPVKQQPPPGIAYATSTDILVLLGEDMEE